MNSQASHYVHTRYPLHEVTLKTVATAMGREPADLLINNGRLVNVNIGKIQEGISVAVRKGFIAYVGPDASHIQVSAETKIVDAQGRFLVPGLIDSHMHIDTSMIEPRSFASVVLPQGTTTVACDNHEVVNVLGLKGVELYHQAAKGLPMKLLIAMPVCVPSIPGFEDAGAAIGAQEVAQAYREGWAQLQGEQMNFPGVIYGNPDVHAILAASLQEGVVLTGHYPSPEIEIGLPAFVASGITACHESTTAEGAMRRVELGCYVQQRYGTAWADMPETIRAYLENPELDNRFFCLATDDISPAMLVQDGHLVRAVRDAIKLGVDPVTVIQMSTINPAQLLEKSRWIGTISPGRAADILIVSDLERFTIDEVYTDGVLVARDGEMTVEFEPFDYPEWALHSVHLPTLSINDMRIPCEAERATVRVIRIQPGKVSTAEEHWEMMPEDGELRADVARDLAKIAVFYRHAEPIDEQGRSSLGFVTGVGLDADVAFGSTVSHDCHNLFVVGTSDEAMVRAANKLAEIGGGMVVVQGEKETLLPLPLAGLMSLENAATVAEQMHALEQALHDAGAKEDSIEMTLSLLPLIVMIELHISNRGLVSLKPGQPPAFVDLILE